MARLLAIRDLGRVPYDEGLRVQRSAFEEVLAGRERGDTRVGILYLLEHDPPVVTVGRRRGARAHVVADAAALGAMGIEVRETDRGGDVTYHGPGQVVAYPVLDLNRLRLGLHAYLRLLEDVALDACRAFGVDARRDPEATGVWVGGEPEGLADRKLCAIGIRVRRWISQHGLALNVAPDMGHFRTIVPCGLEGRAVTSLAMELGDAAPGVDTVKEALGRAFEESVERRA
jgi:lipoate-protein ligase B